MWRMSIWHWTLCEGQRRTRRYQTSCCHDAGSRWKANHHHRICQVSRRQRNHCYCHSLHCRSLRYCSHHYQILLHRLLRMNNWSHFRIPRNEIRLPCCCCHHCYIHLLQQQTSCLPLILHPCICCDSFWPFCVPPWSSQHRQATQPTLLHDYELVE